MLLLNLANIKSFIHHYLLKLYLLELNQAYSYLQGLLTFKTEPPSSVTIRTANSLKSSKSSNAYLNLPAISVYPSL